MSEVREKSQRHAKDTPRTWQGHGVQNPRTRQGHGKDMVQKVKSNENNTLAKLKDMARTWQGHEWSYSVVAKDIMVIPLNDHDCPQTDDLEATCLDWSELEEKEFGFVLATIETREELEGAANRRKFLNAPQLPKWNAMQIQMIKQRKWELEHE